MAVAWMYLELFNSTISPRLDFLAKRYPGHNGSFIKLVVYWPLVLRAAKVENRHMDGPLLLVEYLNHIRVFWGVARQERLVKCRVTGP